MTMYAVVTSALLYAGITIAILSPPKVSAGCTFPSKFQGLWEPEECSSLLVADDQLCQIVIGQSSVSGLTIPDAEHLQFECLMQDGNRFALRSEETSLLTCPVRIYVCWEFIDQDRGILVRQHNDRVSSTSPKRGKAFLKSYSPGIFDCCDVDSSSPSIFRMNRA